MNKKKGSRKKWPIVLASIIGIITALLIAGQIFLNTGKMKNLIVDIASGYVDGNINLDNLEVSLFRKFPNLELSVKNFSLTYPHESFNQYDQKGPKHKLRKAGCGEEVDTLASFKRFSLSLNYIKAITGRYTIHSAQLDSARIHLHFYDKEHSNLGIFHLPENPEEEETSSQLPHIIVKNVSLTGRPEIVFTSMQDSLFASFRMEQALFTGQFSTKVSEQSDLDLQLEKLFTSAQIGKNHVQFGISDLTLNQDQGDYRLDTQVGIQAHLHQMGKINIPVQLGLDFHFPEKDLSAFAFHDLELKVAPVTLRGEGEIKLHGDSTYVRAEMGINECKADEIVQWLGSSILPDLLKIHTDASMSMTAICDGMLIPAEKKLPELLFEFNLPKARVEYDGLDKKGAISTLIDAESDESGLLNVEVKELKADLAGIYLKGKGTMEDALGNDPLISIQATCNTSLDTLTSFLPDSLGLYATGQIQGEVDGMLFLSDMDFYNFAGADISGEFISKDINIDYQPMEIKAHIDSARVSLQPTNSKLDPTLSLGGKVQAVYAEVNNIRADKGKDQYALGRGLSVILQNASSVQSEEFGEEYHPIIAQVAADALIGSDHNHTYAGVIHSVNRFKLSNKKEKDQIYPLLSAHSTNGRIILRQGNGRVSLNGAGLKVTALKQTPWVKKQKAEELLLMDTDSTAVVADTTRPNLADYLQDWSFYGSMNIDTGIVASPFFPLKNQLRQISGSFNNHEISLDELAITSGESDIRATGKVSNIQNAITQHGTLHLNLDILSDNINMNELLTAWTAGNAYVPQVRSDFSGAMDSSVSDEEYMEQITEVTDTAELQDFCLILPKDVDAKINLNANRIKYSDLETSWVSSEIAIRNQCLQITNTLATSNMGDIYFEGYYAGADKENLRAGFDLNLASITADKVVTLFPAVDTLMPMLTSFRGILDCELAAVTDIDSCMNLLTPSINGVLKIKGKNLELDNVGPLKKFAKILMFKNKETGFIDDMSVEGLIAGNELQVFPFVMKIDRYQFAASGIQQFDQNFKYHVSVLKSPIPFRFGIDLKGNFDDWKFHIGKAKYKNTRVPVFSTELNTIQVNLVNSIHDIFTRGVEVAIQQTESGSAAIEEKKKAQGLVLEEESGELSLDEQVEMENTITAHEVEEELVEELDLTTDLPDPETLMENAGETGADESLAPAGKDAGQEAPQKASGKRQKKNDHKKKTDK